MAISKFRSAFEYLLLGLGLFALIGPIGQLVLEAWYADPQVWLHLQSYQLYPSIQQTLFFTIGSTAIAAVIGTAWALLARFSQMPTFLFHLPMLLLLSLPTYVLGFIFLSFLDYYGPVQKILKALISADFFFEPRGVFWAIVIFGISMTPYVYFAVSVGLKQQMASLIEASLSLGAGLRKTLHKVILPNLSPWLSGGAALVALEALADFGFVDLYGINTLSRLLYKSWGSLFSLGAAARVGLLLLLCCFALIFISRKLQQNGPTLSAASPDQNKKKSLRSENWAIFLIWFGGFFIFTLIPLWTLGTQTLRLESWSTLPWLNALLSSLTLALIAGSGVVFFAALIFFVSRQRDFVSQTVLTFLGTGYGLPGTLLAIAFYIFSDRALNIQMTTSDYYALLGLITVLYFCKFNAPVINHLQSQKFQLGSEYFDAAHTLAPYWRNLFCIKIPLYLPSLLLGLILVFIEILKELPAALMIKPFNSPNLALRIHQYASESDWPRASAFSLVLLALTGTLLLLQKLVTDYREKLK